MKMDALGMKKRVKKQQKMVILNVLNMLTKMDALAPQRHANMLQ
jgi:hypothetical protein